jgi:hypothetical protein
MEDKPSYEDAVSAGTYFFNVDDGGVGFGAWDGWALVDHNINDSQYKALTIYTMTGVPSNAMVVTKDGRVKVLKKEVVDDNELVPYYTLKTKLNELAPIAKSGKIEDLDVYEDTMLIFDGGGVDVTLAILGKTTLL